VGLGSGPMDQLPVTLILDRNGNMVKRFDGLAKPDEIRTAVTKAQAAG
jgi:glutathione peroxidase-family protein